jgi:hypothetical protein
VKTREGRIGQKARRSYKVGLNSGNRPVDRLTGGDDLLLTAAGERSDRNGPFEAVRLQYTRTREGNLLKCLMLDHTRSCSLS